jgi:hypothetical protein
VFGDGIIKGNQPCISSFHHQQHSKHLQITEM